MKKKFAFLFLSLLFIFGCGDFEHKTVYNNHVTIEKNGDYLDITVVIHPKNIAMFENYDDYVELLTEALADYLNISNAATFNCSGLETVATEEKSDGHITRFRIPEKSLKILTK